MLRWASWMRTKAWSADVSTRTVGLSTRLALPAPGAVRGVRAAIKLARVSAGRTVKPSALAEGMYRREILPWGLLGLALGLVEGATAAVLEAQAVDARWLYGGGAAAGLTAAWLYRSMRVRREFRLLAAEAASGARSDPFSLRMLMEILREDPSYREYMLWMGIFGAGNLILTAQLVLVFSEQLHLSSATQIGLLAVVPLITQPLFMPWWARLFDGSHVVRYRSRQG